MMIIWYKVHVLIDNSRVYGLSSVPVPLRDETLDEIPGWEDFSLFMWLVSDFEIHTVALVSSRLVGDFYDIPFRCFSAGSLGRWYC